MERNEGRNAAFVGGCRQLAALLRDEECQYRRLLRLAWRQNSYMKRQDVDRLDANALEWARFLPEADRIRIARERLVAELAESAGVTIPPGRISDLFDYLAPEIRREMDRNMARLRGTAGRLARQNELNLLLAEFNLDLAREETEIFRRCVLEDPSGRYDEDAKAAGRGPGGFLVRQA